MSKDPDLTNNLNDSNLIANRYRLHHQLGKGTFGEVFLAHDLKFEPPRAVAIKLLHSKFLNEPEVRADIAREASTLARFSHANILRVLDFDISPNQAFIVTELAEGGSLAHKIRPDPNQPPVQMPLQEVAHYLAQICDGLDEAHAAGLIHRDLKPLNILLDKRNHPLIADFGLATAVSSSQSSVMVDATTSGTPPYMAPEQWMGQIGRASDIYALGIITYQLITGQLPFQGDQNAIAFQHLNAPIPRLIDRAPSLQYQPALDGIIAGVLAKDPRQRIRPAMEFYRLFNEALGTPGTAAVRPVNEKGFPSAVAIPGPNYYPPGQPQQPNAPVNLAYSPTQVPGQPPHGQAGSPYDVTQVPGGSSNYAPTQFANNNALSNYGPTQVIGQAPYMPPVQPVANFTGNHPQTVRVTHSNKKTPLLFGLAALIIVLVVGGIALLAFGNIFTKPQPTPNTTVQAVTTKTAPPATTATASVAATAVPNKVVFYTGLSQTHVTGNVSYPQSPPVGGAHNPIWQNCGIYDQPVVNENAVHSMEHGAVWITYRPNLSAAALEQIRAMVRGKGYIILAPYTGLTSPVVASAWGVQLKPDSGSGPQLADFIATYRQGPQTPEPGAPCTGGVGTPLER